MNAAPALPALLLCLRLCLRLPLLPLLWLLLRLLKCVADLSGSQFFCGTDCIMN
jgi:hypothetical protein